MPFGSPMRPGDLGTMRRLVNDWMHATGGDEAATKDPASRLQVDMLVQFLCTAAQVMENEEVPPIQAEKVIQGILYANTPHWARWRAYEQERVHMQEMLNAKPLRMVVPRETEPTALFGGFTTELLGMTSAENRTITHMLNTRIVSVSASSLSTGTPVKVAWRVLGPQQIAVSIPYPHGPSQDVSVRIEPA